jgi:hypothetical protein
MGTRTDSGRKAAMAATDEQPPVFAYEGGWPFTGTPEVGGHKLTTVTSWGVHAAPDGVPVVTLHLVGPGALKLILADSAARVAVGDETREALVSLGWTPPAGNG